MPDLAKIIDPSELDIFDIHDANEIEISARGLSNEEVLSLWGVTKDDLAPADKKFFRVCCARGRTEANRVAINKLFDQMNGRNGHQACLSYLIRFGDSWDQADDKIKGESFNFKVVMD